MIYMACRYLILKGKQHELDLQEGFYRRHAEILWKVSQETQYITSVSHYSVAQYLLELSQAQITGSRRSMGGTASHSKLSCVRGSTRIESEDCE
jgi:hypothetical protein